MLVDNLLEQGYRDITLLDFSLEALAAIRTRLSDNANKPVYIDQDITKTSLNKVFDIWHDRAVFHFLTSAQDRHNYMVNLAGCLAKNGRAIIGTFSLNGPDDCSGLDIVQYDEEKMTSELKGDLEIDYSKITVHVKPRGAAQEYIFLLSNIKVSDRALQESNSQLEIIL